MKIRLARDEDYPAIALLRKETILNVNAEDYSEVIIHDWTAQTNEHSLRDNAYKYKRWVAEENGTIIGFCDHNFKGEISRIYVHKDHLRKGIGSRLLRVAEASLAESGCKKIAVESTITAKEFYEKNGYEVIKKALHKTGNLESVVYRMSKRLC